MPCTAVCFLLCQTDNITLMCRNKFLESHKDHVSNMKVIRLLWILKDDYIDGDGKDFQDSDHFHWIIVL